MRNFKADVDAAPSRGLQRCRAVAGLPFDRRRQTAERRPPGLDGERLDVMRDAGFVLVNPEIDEIIPLRSESYKRFGDTMDMRVFFEKYVPEDATLVRINSDNGDFLFVLGDRFWGVPRMYAMTGPLP